MATTDRIVMLLDVASGNDPEILQLSQGQLRLLCWLEENAYFSDDLTIRILSDLDPPKRI